MKLRIASFAESCRSVLVSPAAVGWTCCWCHCATVVAPWRAGEDELA